MVPTHLPVALRESIAARTAVVGCIAIQVNFFAILLPDNLHLLVAHRKGVHLKARRLPLLSLRHEARREPLLGALLGGTQLVLCHLDAVGDQRLAQLLLEPAVEA